MGGLYYRVVSFFVLLYQVINPLCIHPSLAFQRRHLSLQAIPPDQLTRNYAEQIMLPFYVLIKHPLTTSLDFIKLREVDSLTTNGGVGIMHLLSTYLPSYSRTPATS